MGDFRKRISVEAVGSQHLPELWNRNPRGSANGEWEEKRGGILQFVLLRRVLQGNTDRETSKKASGYGTAP